mgnify:CR=1 FL=1
MSVTPVELYGNDFNVNSIYDGYKVSSDKSSTTFDSILSAAVDMYKEADSYQKKAEAEEISFALGYTDSVHDLALAQRKANISLQYTVKVTNAVVSAYKELMNMQL